MTAHARHADPDPRPFWRSLGSAALRSLLALTVVSGLFVGLGAVGQPFPRLPSPLDDTSRPGPTEPGSPAVQRPDGAVVRVLDAAADPERAEDAAGTLRELGYDVVGVRPAEDVPEITTVLFAPDAEEAARTLARGDERFSRMSRAPGLPGGVDLYIVVGDDWSASGSPEGGADLRPQAEAVR